MLELDAGQEFDLAREGDFFAAVPQRPGVLLIEMRADGGQPHILRTADLRRATERLLSEPEPGSKRLNLRNVAARIRYRITGSKFEQTLTLYENAKKHAPGRYRDLLRLRPPAVLKVNLRNEYPRCYVTRRIRADDGFYFGPFASRRAAEGFSESFLDLFKTRRCQIRIRRDLNFPGCIYSEMKMCLAPCFAGCTPQEYDAEAFRLVEALATSGEALTNRVQKEREAASEALDFERAAALHKRLEKISGVLRELPELARRLGELDAVILQRGADEKTVGVFPLRGGLLAEPLFLDFGELSSQPRSVEAMLRQSLEPDGASASDGASEAAASSDTNWRERYGLRTAPPELAEHLSLMARWFYSSPRDGEILFREDGWPYRRILRACGRVLAPAAAAPPKPPTP
ncbi:MAG TPA: UvrB/UvrC motif-containing protein [Candidatus Acidoferrum sp.]|nr:UvrB/UvrC motif-containing protein [Candidatus Acidoferrum sp.]